MLDQHSVLNEIATAVQNEQCVLFLGAGVHAPAPPGSPFQYDLPDRPLIGSELSLYLAKRSDFLERRPDEDPKNLPRVAMDFDLTKSRGLLIDTVRAAVQTGKQPSPILRALARLPFPLVLTTNYDTLFEDAAASFTGIDRKVPFVCSYRNNVEREEVTDQYPYRRSFPSAGLPLVVKIHGDILRNAASIVITEEDYIQFLLRMTDKGDFHPLPSDSRMLLSKWPTLFVGYSLRDYNLRLLLRSLRWKVELPPEMYSVDRSPDPLLFEIYRQPPHKMVYVIEDVWRFVPELFKRVIGADLGS